MPPKKDTTGEDANVLLPGFTDKETKLIAAAFLSSIGPDKFDYETMAALTKNTAGSLKKMWPPVKRKAMESHPPFAKFLGQSNGDATASTSEAPKLPAAPKSRKRKPAHEASEDPAKPEPDSSEPDKKPTKKKAATTAAAAATTKKGRGRPKKQPKIESTDEENSADGGDGRGEFTSKRAVQRWLQSTDYE
ncbi:hypothetical protein COCVIDRAFT_93053 [Bipolaris victoriae FI3]|uniref:Uncharacterized protein n=1 Tax=Bipolaris victoriae (strain FI3) TaxID=930091 RepID=W7ETM3_BIPV3|nr:hypothetical protein COCVIDRAFT_93053 [Bipolaris victoriae FI3]